MSDRERARERESERERVRERESKRARERERERVYVCSWSKSSTKCFYECLCVFSSSRVCLGV